MAPRVVTLVPWRPGEAHRDRTWGYVRTHLERDLGYPLVTGDSRGPWARAQACNAAARAAGDWDIALITDADTLLDPGAVDRALRHVARTRGAARPHDRRWMLSLGASRLAMARGVRSLGPQHLRHSAPGGGALVVHRESWDAVGGYDERFVGWGHEDSALNITLVVARRWDLLEGPSWHLYHPSPSRESPTARANRELLDALRLEHGKALGRASARAGFDLNTVL